MRNASSSHEIRYKRVLIISTRKVIPIDTRCIFNTIEFRIGKGMTLTQITAQYASMTTTTHFSASNAEEQEW